MILTDYYKFQHLPDTKSKMRMDCTASTKSYPEFENLRNKAGALFVYFGNVPDNFGGNVHRKADKAISKTKNISSIFVPDVTVGLAYGDVKGTQDAILIVNNSDYSMIEIFIARGYKNQRVNLWQNLADGAYEDEISELRSRAVTDLVTDKKEGEN
jgi:hypothetical protein